MADEEDAERIRKKMRVSEVTAGSRTSKQQQQQKASLSSEVLTALEKLLSDLQKLKKEDGTLPSFYFKVKPDKHLYPDYYVVISNPISFKDISSKLKKHMYTSIEALVADFDLLCQNARTYNQEGSIVYQDSEILRHEFYSRLLTISRSFGLPVIKLPDIGACEVVPVSMQVSASSSASIDPPTQQTLMSLSLPKALFASSIKK